MTGWLEISLTVQPELAEAVADVFARFAPQGVVMEQGVEFRSASDEGLASGDITVRVFLAQDSELEAKRQSLEDARSYLSMIQPLPPFSYRPIEDRNWMEAWKQHYRPMQVGQRLMIVPAWLQVSVTERVPIRINPGMAFGTGTHPSTQLCLELLEREILQQASASIEFHKDTPPRPLRCVIDIGCGSGILSIAALKLGVLEALAVDIDEGSILNARENARLNAIGEELMFGVGSVPDIKAGKYALRSAPLVLANILAPVIIGLIHEGMGEIVDPDGALVIGGILQEQAEGVMLEARAAGFRSSSQVRSADWTAFTFKR